MSTTLFISVRPKSLVKKSVATRSNEFLLHLAGRRLTCKCRFYGRHLHIFVATYCTSDLFRRVERCNYFFGLLRERRYQVSCRYYAFPWASCQRLSHMHCNSQLFAVLLWEPLHSQEIFCELFLDIFSMICFARSMMCKSLYCVISQHMHGCGKDKIITYIDSRL